MSEITQPTEEEILAERYQELLKVIPPLCNIVRGILDENLDVDLVGTLRPSDGDIVATPPFMNVPNIIEHYWLAAESGATFVVRYGEDDQKAWKRSDNQWVEDTKVAKTNSRGRKILTLKDM